MTWAQFDDMGHVTGIFANPQPDVPGVVEVADDDPRIMPPQPIAIAPVISDSAASLRIIRARALIAQGQTTAALTAIMDIIEGTAP
jgi:hypothetical protein